MVSPSNNFNGILRYNNPSQQFSQSSRALNIRRSSSRSSKPIKSRKSSMKQSMLPEIKVSNMANIEDKETCFSDTFYPKYLGDARKSQTELTDIDDEYCLKVRPRVHKLHDSLSRESSDENVNFALPAFKRIVVTPKHIRKEEPFIIRKPSPAEERFSRAVISDHERSASASSYASSRASANLWKVKDTIEKVN